MMGIIQGEEKTWVRGALGDEATQCERAELTQWIYTEGEGVS
jgi:hypothetical protein